MKEESNETHNDNTKTLCNPDGTCRNYLPCCSNRTGAVIFPKKQVEASYMIQAAISQVQPRSVSLFRSKYFWSRPSATSGYPYNPQPGDQISTINKVLIDQISIRTELLKSSGIRLQYHQTLWKPQQAV
jgi:hypothetical protein